jgi:hypothetical protein
MPSFPAPRRRLWELHHRYGKSHARVTRRVGVIFQAVLRQCELGRRLPFSSSLTSPRRYAQVQQKPSCSHTLSRWLRCVMLRNSLGALERGVAFLAAILVGWHGAAPKGRARRQPERKRRAALFQAKYSRPVREAASLTEVSAYSTSEWCLCSSSTVTSKRAGNCSTVAR